MKSIVEAKKTPTPLDFPKLMYHKINGDVVLFLRDGIGIHLTEPGRIGETGGFTSMYKYEDFYGTVTLSN